MRGIQQNIWAQHGKDHGVTDLTKPGRGQLGQWGQRKFSGGKTFLAMGLKTLDKRELGILGLCEYFLGLKDAERAWVQVSQRAKSGLPE